MVKSSKTSKGIIKQDTEKISVPIPEKETSQEININPLQVIGSIAGLAGIAAALLWYFGRFYYLGFFEALNLPDWLPSVNNEDMFEKGTKSLIYMIYDGLSVAVLYYLILNSSNKTYKVISNLIKNRSTRISILAVLTILLPIGAYFIIYNSDIYSKDSVLDNLPVILGIFLLLTGIEIGLVSSIENSQHKYSPLVIGTIRAAFLLLIFTFIFRTHTWSAYREGYKDSCKNTNTRGTGITLFSQVPLDVKNNTGVSKLYFYDQLYLSFIDKDYYYVFKEVSIINAMPKSLILIKKEIINKVEITVFPSTSSDVSLSLYTCSTNALQSSQQKVKHPEKNNFFDLLYLHTRPIK